MYVYGNYFALMLYVYVNYFEWVASVQFFEHSLIGSGRFGGSGQKT